MRHTSLLAMLVPLLLMISNAALADWQYTKWGMTLDEVIAASNGSANRFSDSGRDSETKTTLAIATYTTGDFVFEANFMFSKKKQELCTVSLRLLEGSGHSLYAALVNRYGKPISESKDSITESARWLDEENNNNVVWFVIGTDYITVQYGELIGKSELGL